MATAIKLRAESGLIIGGTLMCANCGAAIAHERHEGDGALQHEVSGLVACKNLCRKEIRAYGKDLAWVTANAYEVWQSDNATWTFYVLAKRQIDDHKLYAIWNCAVVSPYETDMAGHDTYADDVRVRCQRVK
jgi:hypothetical protein